MTEFLTFLHAIVAIVLIVIVLMQSGRGGGLTEGFASAESLFGAKTNEFMIKATTVFATAFLITCLSLAILSSRKGRSLMADQMIPAAGIPVEKVVETMAGETDAQVQAMEERATATEPVLEVPSQEDVSVTVTPVAE